MALQLQNWKKKKLQTHTLRITRLIPEPAMPHIADRYLYIGRCRSIQISANYIGRLFPMSVGLLTLYDLCFKGTFLKREKERLQVEHNKHKYAYQLVLL